MATQSTADGKGIRLFPPAPKHFDPFSAGRHEFERYGLPLRPDAHRHPGMAALWERQARRYRDFERLAPQADGVATPARPGIGPEPLTSCGYRLFSLGAPFTALFVTWTVPDLHFSANPLGPNRFHTFVGLGFLDVLVVMTVDSAQNVTAQLAAQSVGNVNLPVRPGDALSAALCLDTQPPGTAHYVLVNETTGQMLSFVADTGFPPAVTIDAGVCRDGFDQQIHPLAGFGTVYFDEISAYTTAGSRSLTAGDAITMVDGSRTLARPFRLNEFAFKAVFEAA
jgi:hypothetical protein